MNKYSWVLHTADQQDQIEGKIKAWTDIALSYNEKLGQKPTIISIVGDGYSKGIMDFEKGYKKAANNEFRDIKGMSLYTEGPDDSDFAFYYKILMNISLSDVTGFTVYIGIELGPGGTKEQILNEAVIPMCKLVNVSYGYAYVMQPEKGPFSYGKGFIHVPSGHPLSDEERMLIYSWTGYKRGIAEGAGKLRDVYQENILSEKQLNLPVDGKQLKDWILSDPSHGTLSDLAGKPYWKVSSDNLTKVRNTLQQNGVLVAYDEKIVPGLSD